MLEPCTPHIRSSDIHYLSNPFLYFLRRRLGLTRAFGSHSSPTLNRGTWFHTAFEIWLTAPETTDRLPLLWDRITAREGELRTLTAQFGLPSDAALAVLADEKRYALEAFTRLNCALDSRFGPSGSMREHFLEHYELVGAPETDITIREPEMAPLTARVDCLLRAKKTGGLWVCDLKSTTLDPLHRATRCPLEFQTHHYVNVLSSAVTQGLVPGTESLDSIEGMMHLIVSNFDLKFGRGDRRYSWACQSTQRREVARSGTVTEVPGDTPHAPCRYLLSAKDFQNNQTIDVVLDTEDEAVERLREFVKVEPKKNFEGEPDLNIYLNRIKDRYNGTGQYAHEEDNLRKSPPCVISHTYGQEIDRAHRSNYHPLLMEINDLATREPLPENFPKTDIGLEDGQSPFLPLFLYNRSQWPEIVDRERLLVCHRD